jgi:hypothetical protein
MRSGSGAAGEAMGINSHTDYEECLTLLYLTAPGLEVLGRKRNPAPMTKADPTAFLARSDNPVSARLRERALSLGKSALAIYVGIPT